MPCAFDHLLHSTDQIVRGQNWTRRIASPPRQIHIVDAFQDHQPFHAGLAQYVAVKPRQRGNPRSVTKDPITRNAQVQHREVGGGRISNQPL
jgi:hypothetical protein